MIQPTENMVTVYNERLTQSTTNKALHKNEVNKQTQNQAKDIITRLGTDQQGTIQTVLLLGHYDINQAVVST